MIDYQLKGRFEYRNGVRWFRMKRPNLKGHKEGEVQFSTGYRYNGGIIVRGQWVQGILMDKPIVSKGYRLRSIGVGLQLNCCPPYATQYLEKVNPVKNSYQYGICPDCGEEIPDDIAEGEECSNCGHVFYEEKEEDPDPDGRLMGYIHGGKNLDED